MAVVFIGAGLFFFMLSNLIKRQRKENKDFYWADDGQLRLKQLQGSHANIDMPQYISRNFTKVQPYGYTEQQLFRNRANTNARLFNTDDKEAHWSGVMDRVMNRSNITRGARGFATEISPFLKFG
jgi:hypothetical protein